MSADISGPLRELRDALRNPIPDVDSFVFLLSSTLQALHLHPTSVPPEQVANEVIRSINRFLPAIQVQLVTSAIPIFIAALDGPQRGLLETFFVPPKDSASGTLPVRRTIALTSYATLTVLLSTTTPQGKSIPLESREYVLSTLGSLADEYSIDQLYWAVWSSSLTTDDSLGAKSEGLRTLRWEEAVKAGVGLPAKVANAVGRWMADRWSAGPYFDRLIRNLEGLMYEISQSLPSHDLSSIRLAFQRLASLGLLTARPTLEISPSPSLLTPLLSPLLAHLHPAPGSPLPAYPPTYLPSLLLPLPASILASFVESLLEHLAFRLVPPGSDPLQPDRPDERIKRAGKVLNLFIGPAKTGGEAMEAVVRGVIGGKLGGVVQDQAHSRIRMTVAWIGEGGERAMSAFLEAIMEAWTDAKNVKFSLYAQQIALTHSFLVGLSLLPPFHPFLVSLSHRPGLLTAMQSYLAHPDPKIRRLGMLEAEVISELSIEDNGEDRPSNQQEELDELKAGLEVDEDSGDPKTPKKPQGSGMKRLRFGKDMWDGDGDGREECRWLRRAVGVRDQHARLSEDSAGKAWMLGWDSIPPTNIPPAPTVIGRPERRGRAEARRPAPSRPQPRIIMLDPDQMADPLEGYANASPTSSRSPSPTPSYLEEVAADPSLALDSTQKKKITRPVYIQQLVALLKEREKPDHLEMGLKWGEGLVRAKRSFGRELEESAVAVAVMTISLNDPFHLEGFEEKRQGLLTASVACSPKNVAPFLAEQYFSAQFSLYQKGVILTAIAMGARELAGLSVPAAVATARRIDFPSKTFPPALHQKYISPADTSPAIAGQLDQAISGVRLLLLSKGARKGEETVPELAREKRLRVGNTKRKIVAEVGSLADRQMSDQQPPSQTPVVPFKDVAAECFIMPLINRFWQHLQDASIREERALGSGSRYRGAGTGMVLSPMALEKFLMTLSLLLHAARHSPLFLAVLSPEAIELALTIGSRHPSRSDDNPITNPDEERSDGSQQEALVVGAALETSLVCLDTSFELDSGRTLALDKPQLIVAVGEWAGGVFEVESRGGQVAAGQGGMREGRIKAAAAGVVVKVSEIGEKWRRLGMLR